MQKRLFFLKQDGWFEVEVTAKLLNSSNEELLQWTYAMMDKHGYRNYLITENPGPVIGVRNNLRYAKIGVPCSMLFFQIDSEKHRTKLVPIHRENTE